MNFGSWNGVEILPKTVSNVHRRWCFEDFSNPAKFLVILKCEEKSAQFIELEFFGKCVPNFEDSTPWRVVP